MENTKEDEGAGEVIVLSDDDDNHQNSDVIEVGDDQNQNKCEICGEFFTGLEHLKTHMLRLTGAKVYSCTICKKQFQTMMLLNRHKIRVHMPYKCKTCGVRIDGHKNYRTHLREHSKETTTRKCPICSQKFDNIEDLMLHMAAHAREKPNMCEVCGAGFDLLKELQTHYAKDHLKVDRVEGILCDMCGCAFYSSRIYNYHLLIVHNEVKTMDDD